MFRFGVVELGLTPEIFWQLTPCQFSELTKQHTLKRMRADMRAGLIAATLVNINIDSKKHQPYSWSEFFGEWKEFFSEVASEDHQANLFLHLQALAETADDDKIESEGVDNGGH